MRITLPDLVPNTNYYVEFQTILANGVLSPWSPKFSLLTDQYIVKPLVPDNLAVAPVGNAFNLTWDAVTMNELFQVIPIVRYELEIAKYNAVDVDPEAYAYLVASAQTTSENSNQVSFNLSFEQNTAIFGGEPAAHIGVRVRAVDNLDIKSDWSEPVEAQNSVPDPPTSFNGTAGLNTISLSWVESPSDDVIGYNIYTGTTGGFTPSVGNKIFFGLATTFIYTTATYSNQYFKIATVDEFGQESSFVSFGPIMPTSPFTIDVTPPGQPTSITATITTDDVIALTTYMDVSWALASPPADLAGFQIRYRKGTSGSYEYASVDDSTLATRIRGLEPYVNYQVSVQSFDFFGNYSGFPANITATGATNSAPSQPTAPTVAANTMQIQVTPTGNKQSGGAMQTDVSYYEVYVSTNNALATTSMTLVGSIPTGPSMATVFPIPAQAGTGSTQTWYAKVVAVDNGGLKSSDSPASSGANAALIANVNIADATISSAKITDLAADKLTAGTGIINDLTIKAILTIGDGSTSAYIRSYDWVSSGGVTGYEVSKSAITIRNGTIYANTLQLQDSTNIIPTEFASFENSTIYYQSGTTRTFAFFDSIAASDARHGGQVGIQQWVAAGSGFSRVIFAPTSTTYNITVEPSTTYIVSAYFQKTSGTLQDLRFEFKDNDAVTTTVGSLTATTVTNTTGWVRISGTFTTTSTATNGNLAIRFDATPAGAVRYDAVQMERKTGGLNTPSPYSNPGFTHLDGSGIRTGSIISTSLTGLGGTPLWSIPMNGSATFQNLLVRGTSVVGSSGDGTSSLIQSFNYVAGTSGWKIDAAGNSEFQSATVRGAITATSGSITGALDISGGSGKIRINGTSGARIELTQNAINAYNTGGTSTFNLDGTTGSLTVTSATISGQFQTGTTGNHTIIRNDGTYGVIEFFSGQATYSEVPGKISNAWFDLGGGNYQKYVSIQAGQLNGQDTSTIAVTSRSSSGTASNINLVSDSISLNGDTSIYGSTTNLWATNVNALNNLGVSAAFTSVGTTSLNTSGSGGVWANLPTGGPSGNVFINSSNQFFHVSSSRRYKENIISPTVSAKTLLALEPRSFIWKDQKTAKLVGSEGQVHGFIAEEADSLGLNEWVQYNEDGTPESFYYDKWTVALHIIVKEQQKQIEELQSQVKDLTSRV